MLAAIRAFAKSWFAKVLFAVLAISFVSWGATQRMGFTGKMSDDVVRAGGHSVRSAEYKRLFDADVLKPASDRAGRAVSAEEAVQAGLGQVFLQQIAVNTSLEELIRRLGVRPSDTLVAREIAKVPFFVDPVTRVFDRKTYLSLLAQNGMTPDVYEAGARDDLARTQFLSGITAGLRTPRIYGAVLAAFNFEQRQGAYFSVDLKSVGTIPPPTDAQLNQLITENAAQLRRPEMRAVSLVRFSAAALAPSMPVNPADVQKQFDLRKSALSTPEKRSFVQIAVATAAQAQDAAARLNRGEQPQAVAKAISGARIIPYQNAQQIAVPDPKVGQAAFSLQAGQVSQPIQAQVGYAVVKVGTVTAGKAATLDEARPEIVKQLQQAAAEEKVYADAQKYGDAHDSGANLAKAAQTSGAKVYALGPMTAQGRDAAGQPVVGLSDPMLKAAFSTPQGGETDLTSLGKGEYYALRVEKVSPPSLPTVAELRPQLMMFWMRREATKRMQARADQYVARIKAGEKLQAVAASAGAQVKQIPSISRAAISGQQNPELQNFLNQLFQVKLNQVFTAQGPGAAVSVAQVTAVTPANPGYAAAVARLPQNDLSPIQSREIAELLGQFAAQRIKPRADSAKALQALGVQPSDAPPPAAKGGPARAPSLAK